MLKKTGHQVEVHNYIDDLGNQLADTVVGILNTTTEQPYERFGDFCWETYAKINKAYKDEPDMLKQREIVLQLEEGAFQYSVDGTARLRRESFASMSRK